MSIQPILSNLGPGIIKQARAILNNTQILALPTTGIEVVPKPGEGKIIIFNYAIGKLNCLAAAYGGFGTDKIIQFRLGTWGISGVYVEDDQGAFADDSSIHLLYWPPQYPLGNTPEASWFSDIDNANIPLKLISTNVTDYSGGNAANSLVINVQYSIFNLETGLLEV